ncbi:tetratricopeptide repeat protein [Flavobacteriaceae bacterium D16]|nr:tetratricopeptide repeat protein [Flavobacteriaceae bacterium D16]
MKFKDFISECHDKEVFKNLSIYIVSSWVLIQVFSVIWEPFGLPKSSMTYLLLILLIGFPFYIYVLWRFRLKPLESKLSRREGLKYTGETATSKSVSKGLKKRKIHLPGVHFYSPFQKMYFTALFVITLVAVFSASLIVRANFLGGHTAENFALPSIAEDNKRIAVLTFDNDTGDETLDVVGKMAEDWIMHGITENKAGQVISPKMVEEYTEVLKASIVPSGEHSVLKEYLKPGQVVTGTYYLNKGRLLIQCSIMDGNLNRTLIAFETVECSPEGALDCIEALKRRIIGYLISADEEQIGLEEIPPNYEAYQLFLEADNIDYDEPEHLRLLNEAIAADETFFKPKVDRVSYYYNQGEFAFADSLLQILSKETRITNTRQKNIIQHYDALLKGDYRNAYKYWKEEYNLEPYSLELNAVAMVLALQMVNLPEEIDPIYEAYPLTGEDLDIDNCVECEDRLYIKGMANLELGRTSETIDLLTPYARTEDKGYGWLKEVLIRAYVMEENEVEVDRIMERIKLISEEPKYWHKSCLITGNEFQRVGNQELAFKYYDQLINSLENYREQVSQEQKELLARAYFYKGNYQKAQEILEQLIPESGNQIRLMAYLAIAYHKTGKTGMAQRQIRTLNGLRADYQYGSVDYALARYHASVGNPSIAMRYLLKAVAEGKRYTPAAYHHDILLKPYINEPDFNRVMSFWH